MGSKWEEKDKLVHISSYMPTLDLSTPTCTQEQKRDYLWEGKRPEDGEGHGRARGANMRKFY